MATALLPVTDHDRWTRTLAEVAVETEPTDTEIVVLYVFTPEDVDSTVSHLDIDDESPNPTELARRKASIGTAVETLEAGGFETRVRGTVVEEQTGDGVLDIASDVDADRIYMYSRKRSPTGKAIFGSQLQEVLFKSHIPVVVAPAKSVSSTAH